MLSVSLRLVGMIFVAGMNLISTSGKHGMVHNTEVRQHQKNSRLNSNNGYARSSEPSIDTLTKTWLRNAHSSATSIEDMIAMVMCSIANSTSVSTVYHSWKCSDISFGDEFCNWDHVLCNNSDKSVVKISLSNNCLTGVLPSNIGLLSSLTSLKLGKNKLRGTLPTSLGLLSKLQDLRINSNCLSGTIPKESGLLTNLVSLYLSQNALSGIIPSSIGYLNKLTGLYMSYNHLSGALPTSFTSLTSLISIKLLSNKISGPIPSTIGLLSELTFIDISRNMLTSTLPSTISHLKKLYNLRCSRNKLTGSIPIELTYISGLQRLILSANSFTGIIPSEFGYLTQLTVLNLCINSLTGTIPRELGLLSSMFVLFFSANSLTGIIPSELGQFSQIYALCMSLNKLTGVIPTELGRLSRSVYLTLNYNKLTGTIPTQLGFLPRMGIFFLNGNKLTGTIPTQLGYLSQASYIYLDRNKLSGTIPKQLGYRSRLIELRLSSNRLTGTLPSSLGELSSIKILTLSNNRFSGTIPSTFNHSTAVTQVDLSNNLLTGSLPTSICGLKSLSGLFLEENILTGSLPSCIGNLKSLRTFRIENNRLTGSVPKTFCSIYFDTFYMNKTFIKSFPSCLRATFSDFLESIPHEVGPMDTGLCELAEIVQQSNTISQLVIAQSPVVYESEHPMVTNSRDSGVTTILISTENAFEYQIVFDVVSQTVCPVRFCVDSSCNNIISEYNGEKGLFPGTGRIPPLIIYRPLFYLSTGSISCTSGAGQNWGYKLTVRASSRGSGWACTKVYTTASSTGNLRGLSSPTLPYAVNPCSWTGVVCESLVNVTALSLRTFGLPSTLPSSLQFLSFLTSLDLSYNQFRGTLPSAIGYLRNLQLLDLTNNRLSGPFPSVIVSLSLLRSLSLSQNLFSGSIPDFITTMTYLSKLDLKSNLFSGKVSNNICPIVQSSQNTSVTFLNNPKLTCYESCWSRYASTVFGDEIPTCTPSSAPTSHPTSPTLTPTRANVESTDAPEVLSTGGVVGISIASFVVVTVFVSILVLLARAHKKKSVDNRLLALESLPLHRLGYEKKELTEELIKEHLHTAFLKDFDNKTLLNIILERGDGCRISPHNLYVLLEDQLSSFIESNKIGEEQPSEVWAQLVQMDDDRSVEVVEMFLKTFKYQVQLLSYGKDSQGRSYIDLASARSKVLIRRKLYLHQRYQLYPTCEHRSPTCQVWLAIYHMHPDDGDDKKDITQNTYSVVALKFMKHKNQFLCEVESRREGDFDGQFVIGVKKSYDGTSEDANEIAFRSDAISKGFEEYPYCLVMEGADENLANLILNNNIAAQNIGLIKIILKNVLSALQHMHDKGIMHGDIKPSNIVAVGRIFKLIDLDAAASIHRGDYVGAKYSSLYSPPEMFWESKKGIVTLRTFNRDSLLDKSMTEYPYSLVKAAASHDIWSVGVLFYYLATGSSLVLGNSQDNIVEQRDMKLILDWDHDTKYQKIMHLTDQFNSTTGVESIDTDVSIMRNFLSMLLCKDPSKRLSARKALDHPFLSGKKLGRPLGFTVEYDVFLSYRVDKDEDMAEKVYQSLTELGVRVFKNDTTMRVEGQNLELERGILKELLKSACFVCLLTRGSINVAEMNTIAEGKGTNGSQNLVLEWLLALELSARGWMHGIYPVMIGDNNGFDNFSNYFASGCHPSNMNEVSNTVELELYTHFRRQLEEEALGLPYRNQESSSVSGVVKAILMNQGFLFEGNSDDALIELTHKIHGMSESFKVQGATDSAKNRRSSFIGSNKLSKDVKPTEVEKSAVI